jgi:hypothetical protein
MLNEEESFFKKVIQLGLFMMLYALIKNNKLDAKKLYKAVESENVYDGINELRRQFKEMEKKENDRQ